MVHRCRVARAAIDRSSPPIPATNVVDWFGIHYGQVGYGYYGQLDCTLVNINVQSYQKYIDLWEDKMYEIWNVKIINVYLIAMYTLLKSIASINVAKHQIIKHLKDMKNKLSLSSGIFNIIYINMWFVTNAMLMEILLPTYNIDSRIKIPLSEAYNNDFIEVNLEKYPHIIAEKLKLKEECYHLYPQLLEKIHLLSY